MSRVARRSADDCEVLDAMEDILSLLSRPSLVVVDSGRGPRVLCLFEASEEEGGGVAVGTVVARLGSNSRRDASAFAVILFELG